MQTRRFAMDLPVAIGADMNNAGVGHRHTDSSSTARARAMITADNGNNGQPSAAAGSSAAGKSDAVKDNYWVAIDQRDMLGSVSGGGGGEGRPLLFQNKKVKDIILYPYRALIFLRLIGIILFFVWRIQRPDNVARWLWAPSVAGDVYFGFSWLLNQLPKLNPIKRIPDLAALNHQYDPPDGSSHLPGVDVFVTTAHPIDEPILETMNSILSILAMDYPVDKYACYLSDDAGALIQYEAMVETASFAELWVPFSRKHCVEPRAPANYFEVKARPYKGRAPEEFVNDHRLVRREYDEFKVRINALQNIICRRSDAYNRANSKEGDAKATWMADGTQWPGTWIETSENHKKGQHAGISKVVLNHPSYEPHFGQPARAHSPLDFSAVDMRLPMLVYLSREKDPDFEHKKKAGALNVLLRASAVLSNAPFVINFDCDHYINNSQALRAAVCFMLDPREGDNTGFVQFPQRFDDVDPTDRYCNHNRVFFDGTMLALNGIQGPSYLGTGCMFRRVALYGIDPPSWRPDDATTYKADRFGNSTSFLSSIPGAANQDRSITPVPLNELIAAEMTAIMSCTYEKETEWGGDVGFIYDIATEDVVTGYRIHRQGWRSMHCTLEPEAFRGCAPINLTERLYQILRWSGGSLEMFFSHNCPLLAGCRLQPMQRIAYLNMTIYPVTSLFILLYGLYPVTWFFAEEYYIQWPFTTYVLYLLGIIAMVHLIGSLEIKWAGITWLDWWRNEQFFTVGSVSSYPTVVLHMVVKLVTRKGISFRITSKQTASTTEKFADMYVVRWAPLLIPAVAVLAVNIGGFGVGMGKIVVYHEVWSAAKMRRALLGLMFNVWLLVLLYPFALAMMGRWSKRPFLLLIMLVLAFVVVGIAYVGAHTLLVNLGMFQEERSERIIPPGKPAWLAGRFRPFSSI